MKRILIVCATVALIAALGFAVHTATLDGLDGLIFGSLFEEDTVYAPNYSDTSFRKITAGMSESEVIRLLGQPISVWTTTTSRVGMRWSWSPGDTHYRQRVVWFSNSVVEKRQSEFYVD